MAKETGDLITHCNSARTRVSGEGSLVGILYDSAGNGQIMFPRPIEENANKSVTHLANFRAERVAFEIRVVEIDEWFSVSNMYAYVKLTAGSYPQL